MNPNHLIASIEYIKPNADKFAREFYGQLFTRSKEAHEIFTNRSTNMKRQQALLMATLEAVARGVKDDLPRTKEVIRELGIRHVIYGAPEEFYPLVGEVLLSTLKKFMGCGWTPEMEKSWKEAYEVISGIMVNSYQETQ